MEHLQNGGTLIIAIYHKRGNGVFSLRCSAWQQWKLHSNSINGRKTGETGMKEMWSNTWTLQITWSVSIVINNINNQLWSTNIMQRRDSINISFLSVLKTISFLSNIKISSTYSLERDYKNIWFGSVWWKFVKHE